MKRGSQRAQIPIAAGNKDHNVVSFVVLSALCDLTPASFLQQLHGLYKAILF
jgi:hypothetical protein